ncbi:hypothetical protein VIGAN_UM095700 [Vigna angularis var. angularis]|uniref:Uncharacterized protein n=1 Tax=Vigna angularis var. angularis TaxID=157739 RepID=A0A0S3TEK5_PHAAN|nr:hypothetical protein VIGAN_UM095700 [Vigna angularis var. angularis]
MLQPLRKLVSGKIPVGQLTDRSLYLQRMVLLLYFPQLSQLFVLGLDPPGMVWIRIINSPWDCHKNRH